MTPRTDKLYEEVWRFTNETDAVDALISMRDLCRELERDNAALREALDSAIVLLRRWNKNDVNDDVVIETRKAIYAARKEAQP